MTTPVDSINGIGPKTTEFLKKRRITTVEALLKRGVSALENAPGFSPGRATKIIQEAKKSLGSTSKKQAKLSTKAKPKKDKSDKKSKKDKNNNKKSKDKVSKDKKGKKNKKDKKNKKAKKDKKNKKNKK